MPKSLPLLFALLFITIGFAQPDIKNDFRLVVSDTIWAPSEPDESGAYPIFKTKEALLQYFEEQNISYDSYTFSAGDSLYVSNKPITNKEYADFCKATRKQVPVYDTAAAASPVTDLSNEDLNEYYGYIEKLWGVWVTEASGYDFHYTFNFPTEGYYLTISLYEWNLKLICDKLNASLQEAYGSKPPLVFRHNGVYTSQNTIIEWSDIDSLTVDRYAGKAILKLVDGNNFTFSFNKQQYKSIATLHEVFLANKDTILFKW